MLRGYDIDGTLTTGLRPVKPYVVISGRTIAEYDETVKKLANEAPVYIRCTGKVGDRIAAGNFKAEVIKLLDVKEFYEDDEVQAQIIRDRCPEVVVKMAPSFS